MSLKEFVSGISALAVAASAFAAMAVTASAATEYKDIAITPGTLYRVSDNGNGTFHTANNSSSGYSGVIADLSGQTDIADASTVTVEFDTHVIASGGKTPILMYGVGDKATRGLTANGSSAGSYKTEGLAAYFGSLNGTAYNVYGKGTTNYASNVANKDVHAKITLDREADTYELTLTVGASKVTSSGDTSVDNLTVIEAITWGAAAYDITFKNIKVSYTVPDGGAAGVAATGTDYTGKDGTTASLWNGTVAANAATKVIAVATLSDGVTTASGETPLDGTYTGNVEIYVVVNKAVAELSGVTLSFE